MQDNEEFQQIGKEIPYKVPPGFFESFAEKTLKEAIVREQIHKRNNIIRLFLSVAASIALLFYLGLHLRQDSDLIQSPNLIAEGTKPTNQSVTKTSGETIKHKDFNELKKEIPMTIQEKTEVLRDILSDLSDDDLDQIAIRYKTDTFINESLQ